MFLKLTHTKLLVLAFGIVLLYSSCEKKDDQSLVLTGMMSPLIALTGVYPQEAGFGDSVLLVSENIFTPDSKPIIKINDIALNIVKLRKDSAIVVIPKMLGSGSVKVEFNGRVHSGFEFKYRYKATVTTIAGSGYVGAADGAPLAATFNAPWGLALNNAGDLYVADSYNRSIRKISGTTHVVSTVGIPYNFRGFSSPYNLIVGNNQDELYVTDFGNSVMKITSGHTYDIIYKGNMTTTGIAMNKDGSLYVGNNIAGSIMKMTDEGRDTAIFAKGLITPRNLFFDKNDNLYVSAYDGRSQAAVLHKIDPSGKITNIPLNKTFSGWEMAMDTRGNFYGADHFNNNIIIVEKNGRISVLAGSGLAKDVDGIGTKASLNGPMGLVIDKNDNLYFSTYNFEQKTGNKIRKVVIE